MVNIKDILLILLRITDALAYNANTKIHDFLDIYFFKIQADFSQHLGLLVLVSHSAERH